jgi:signal transduction histidine kinase/CheY-like chemotaxis protein/HAMP domain-containing protein
MKMKNIKITTQIVFAFLIVAISFSIFGYVEYRHNVEVFKNAEILYYHPLQVRKAIDQLKLDVYEAEVAAYNITLLDDDILIQQQFSIINHKLDNSSNQFVILREYYLGPIEDINNLYNAYIDWHLSIESFMFLVEHDDVDGAQSTLLANGAVEVNRKLLEVETQVVDDFAVAKANSLYEESLLEHDQLLQESLVFLISLVMLTGLIGYVLIYQIERPIRILTSATKDFHQGNMKARSSYLSKNEFGLLSESINTLVNTIELNTLLSNNVKEIADRMLESETSSEFFHDTLEALMIHTNSNSGIIYLLNETTDKYVHCDSIGLSEPYKTEFSKSNFDGEIGLAISTKNTQWIKDIPDDTFLNMSTGYGVMKPKEIITIPIISHSRVLVVISIATIHQYDSKTLEYIELVKLNIISRVGNILNYEKANEFAEELEKKNIELEVQTNELTSMTNELLQHNRELDVQKQELTKANQMKTIFLSNMSHELRTPLNSVIALSSVLIRRLSKKIPDEEHSYLEVIEKNGKHLLEVINDILDISRIEAGKEEIFLSRFDIKTLILDVVGMLSPLSKEKSIEIELSSNMSSTFIDSDVKKVNHIAHNIIGNAIKFTKKGKVEIEIEDDNEFINVFVKDTGIGISEEAIPFIFDEFRQADSSTSKRFGGTGLGLAIAQKYANFLGGCIKVNSEIGVGSEFIIQLPKESKDNNPLANTIMVGSKKRIRNQIDNTFNPASKTILLVDDSEPAIIQVEDLLKTYGFKTIIANNAASALDLMSSNQVDGIILDLMMPDLDGFETLKIIRNSKKTATIPVLILTAKHISKKELLFLEQNNVHELIQKGDINKKVLLDSVYSMFIKKEIKLKTTKSIKKNTAKVIKILVVEDNPDNMLTVNALLKNKYEIIEATTGEDAIKLAEKYTPNLVLMDIALPGITGIEAFKQIRSNPKLKHIPIIALTASALASDRDAILSCGFNAYIPKPIFEESFYQILEEVLNGKE